MIEQVPEADDFYEEFKEAMRYARDPMSGQSKLVDVLL